MEERQQLFNALFHFARKLDFHYACLKIKKDNPSDVIKMTSRISKSLSILLRVNESFITGFDKIIVYYDNGQIELTRIITSVFSTLYSNVEFRKVLPADYKLFQIADLICTMELLSVKTESGGFSNSEKQFFGNTRDFKKNYMKWIQKKHI